MTVYARVLPGNQRDAANTFAAGEGGSRNVTNVSELEVRVLRHAVDQGDHDADHQEAARDERADFLTIVATNGSMLFTSSLIAARSAWDGPRLLR